PDLALILPERPRRDVRGPERQASRRRNVLETLQRRVDARNMIPQGVFVEAEVMEVEQALRVPAQTDDGPREQVEVVGVDPEGDGRLTRHADRRSVVAGPYEEGSSVLRRDSYFQEPAGVGCGLGSDNARSRLK